MEDPAVATSSSSAVSSPRTASETKRKLAEIKISIRCLAMTLWFFTSQMCTFLPGVFLVGCDQVSQQQQVQVRDTNRKTNIALR